MLERRNNKCRRHEVWIRFPVMDHLGNFIKSERRHRPTRRVYDVFVDDVDLPIIPLRYKNS
jgi:hypothetical protein